MEGSVFAPALKELQHVKSDQGEILTKRFLDACRHILPVIDKFGAAMTLVKFDIGGNNLKKVLTSYMLLQKILISLRMNSYLLTI
jgi:hypothetical protein